MGESFFETSGLIIVLTSSVKIEQGTVRNWCPPKIKIHASGNSQMFSTENGCPCSVQKSGHPKTNHTDENPGYCNFENITIKQHYYQVIGRREHQRQYPEAY